jgi:hypothetical protein
MADTYLSLAEILERALAQDDIEIPEWGGTVRVSAITAAELGRAQRAATNPRNGETDNVKLQALVAERGLVEPKLAPGQYNALLNKEIGPLSKIAERILELSGLKEDEDLDVDQGEA